MEKRVKSLLIIATSIITVLILVAAFTYLNFTKHQSDPYKDMEKIQYSELFDKEGDYYVYAYKIACPYCKAIENEIIKFADQKTVYFLDIDTNEERPRYNWKDHHMRHDIEIGQLDSNGIATYYENIDIELYKNKKNKDGDGNYTKYKILIADDTYIQGVNSNGEINKVYASLRTPVLDYKDDNEVVVPAVPMLFNIVDGKIISYYYDSDEIAEFLIDQGIPADGEI